MGIKRHITGFYIETLILILVFVFVILVTADVFGSARVKSSEAALLTEAVSICVNGAEALAASETPQELREILDENGNASLDGSVVTARYDRTGAPDPQGELVLTCEWTESDNLVEAPLRVTLGDREIYSITAARAGEGTI